MAAGALTLLAGCGPNEETRKLGQDDDSALSTIDAGPTTTTSGRKLFEVTHEWDLPGHEKLEEVSQTTCYNDFWTDEEGKRRPAVQTDPLIVRVEGRCNTPLNSELVGGYYTAEQRGSAPVKLRNGDALGAECRINGQDIMDIRGAASSSRVWLGAVTASGAQVFVPEVNVGYVDEGSLAPCQLV
jgi:hypothetical protein